VAQYSFDSIDLAALRRRKSEKWVTHPPDVLPAFVAEMDFELAQPIRNVLHEAVESGDSGYAWPAELRSAFAEFAARRFAWNIERDRVFAVPDVMAGVEESLRLFTERGAGVVINPPVYPPFFQVIENSERRVVCVDLDRDLSGRYSVDMNGLEHAFADGAKAYLLCSPHNPVGRVWTRAELEPIAELARRYDVAIISDEIHAPLTMPAIDFVPMLTVSDEEQSCITLTAASKAWNIAGLKCGIMTANGRTHAPLRAQLTRRADEVLYRTGHFGVLASIAAFRDGEGWLDALREHLNNNRRRLEDRLHQSIPAIRYRPGEATYLAWLDCRELDFGDDPAARFLERGRVALERGTKFGSTGAGFVRLNLGTSSAILDEIVERMSRALD
jgi:cystathionine beta-lyase